MTEVAPLLPRRRHVGGPAVTVVMPTWRRASHIGESVRSLLAQTWNDFELLVRDDGDGDDGTPAEVERAASGDRRVRYHRNSCRLGMPDNLNAGIAESRGEFIAVCHDHDVYRPRFLQAMLTALRRCPSALFAHCATDVIDRDGALVSRQVRGWPELTPGLAWLRIMLARLNCPVCALTVVRRGAHERYGLYDTRYGFVADVEMWMRLTLHGDVAYVREPLIRIRSRDVDHWAVAEGLSLLRTVAAIYRRYLARAYGNPRRLSERAVLEWRIARKLTRECVARMTRSFRRTWGRASEAAERAAAAVR